MKSTRVIVDGGEIGPARDITRITAEATFFSPISSRLPSFTLRSALRPPFKTLSIHSRRSPHNHACRGPGWTQAWFTCYNGRGKDGCDSLRILHSIVLDGWSAGSWYAVNLARRLDLLGHENLFVCRPNCRTRDEAAAAGLRIDDRFNLESKNPVRMAQNLGGLAGLMREWKPDVICAHWGEDHASWGIVKLLHGGRAPLVRVRSLDPKPPRAHLFSRWLHHRQTRLVIVTNSYLRKCYKERLGLADETVHVVPPGLDFAPFADLAPMPAHSSGFKAEHPTVGLVARFSPVKGHAVFFRAARLVADVIPQVRFVVAGFESELSAADIARMAKESGVIEQTEFITTRTGPSAPIIARFDVGVVSSVYSESVSRCLMEYLAAVVPAVATDVGGIPDLLAAGDFGILVPPRDADALARGVIELLRDRDRRLRLGEAGCEFIRTQRTWEKCAAQFACSLESVVKKKSWQVGFRVPCAGGKRDEKPDDD